ncbi:hypothetical protein FH972_024432 [Carpinus fangiana]|uniref:XPG-I domain-containing protein n=1 Tax=Carpinus fangiana TaxID=176857 RepID=A0A5N6KY07_9ROSI|nr:hypothetical protein FH972_024432 [Carpinus fangiana]
MIHEFPVWSAPRAEVCAFTELKDTTLAIEANFYLERLINSKPWREPLLSALGGLPFAMENHIRKELGILRDAGIASLFVFHGLDAGEKYKPFDAQTKAALANGQAWTLYGQTQPDEAVQAFGNSGYAQPEHLYRMLQAILRDEKVDFQVAPYTAWGQQSCQEELSTTTADMFVDACLLSGNAILPTLPLLSANRRPQKIKTAVEMIKGVPGQSAIALCLGNQENPQMKEQDYLNRYRRSRLAIKHQVVLSSDGKIVLPEQQDLPGDMDVFLGLQLPDELYYYLSIGVIGPRILNQFTSKAIQEVTPVDGGDSQTYRNLIAEKLTPVRLLTLAVLGYSIHRGFQYQPVTLNTWFSPEPERATVLKIRETYPQNPSDTFLNSWSVHEDIFKASLSAEQPTIAHALQLLKDPAFASKTVTTKNKASPNFLKTKPEVSLNTIWRFLHLRNYVDDKHNLTPWGNVLSTILSKLQATDAPEAAAVVATELLRYDLLTSDDMFPTYSGAPSGSETHRRNCLLISRIACLGKLQHESIGFTGPLSRHMLGYTSIINAVNNSLRDLVEVSLTSMLLNGDVDREREDLTDISFDLPFLLPYDCALGVAMKHYLDELQISPDGPPSQEKKESLMETSKNNWLPKAKNVRGDIERMFCLWDAVYEGIKVGLAQGLVKGDKEKWAALDKWAQERRCP